MAARGGVLRKYASGLSLLSRMLDVCACIVAALFAYLLRFDSAQVFYHPGYPALILIGALLVLIVFPMTGLYQSWRAHPLFAPIGRALLAWVMVFALLLILLVMVKRSEHFSRVWLLHWFWLQALLLVLLRFVTYGSLLWLRRHGYNRRYVVVVGSGARARALIQQVRESASSGFEVVAVFNGNEGSVEIQGHRSQPLKELTGYVAARAVDEIWITLPLEQSQKLREVLVHLHDASANVRYAPDLQDLFLLNHGVTQILDVPMIDLMASPMQGNGRLLKALEDRLLALLILVLVSPLMIVIAIGVKLSSTGSVLYRQRRHGWDGREIVIYKFRTMRLHTEDAGQVTQASLGDARLTTLGAFLRRTSLDELPQFINVLQGRMSIVGPRPHAVEHNAQYRTIINRYMLRHIVKPGITGWAQVNGWRGITNTPDKMQHRVEYDLYYIDNWSLWFDLKIICLTLFKGFVNKNAY